MSERIFRNPFDIEFIARKWHVNDSASVTTRDNKAVHRTGDNFNAVFQQRSAVEAGKRNIQTSQNVDS